jgi:hypothetical protein
LIEKSKNGQRTFNGLSTFDTVETGDTFPLESIANSLRSANHFEGVFVFGNDTIHQIDLFEKTVQRIFVSMLARRVDRPKLERKPHALNIAQTKTTDLSTNLTKAKSANVRVRGCRVDHIVLRKIMKIQLIDLTTEILSNHPSPIVMSKELVDRSIDYESSRLPINQWMLVQKIQYTRFDLVQWIGSLSGSDRCYDQ